MPRLAGAFGKFWPTFVSVDQGARIAGIWRDLNH